MSTEITRDALVEHVELAGISFFEVSAQKTSDASEHAQAEPKGDSEVEVLPVYGLQTESREDDSGFRVRIRTEIEVEFGLIVVEVAAEYLLNEIKASELSQEVMLDFVNNITVMTLVPYIRQSISDITLRVFGIPLTMPILQRGELSFGPPADAAAAG